MSNKHTFEAVSSVFVVLLLLEAICLQQGVRMVLEAGDRVGSWRRGLETTRTGQNRRNTNRSYYNGYGECPYLEAAPDWGRVEDKETFLDITHPTWLSTGGF